MSTDRPSFTSSTRSRRAIAAALVLTGLAGAMGRYGGSAPATPGPVSRARAPSDAPLVLDGQDPAGAAATEGLRELQAVRETGDLTAYGRAGAALDRALAADPDRFEAVYGKAMLLLGLHQFRAGLPWIHRAMALNPSSAPALGLLVDAQVELGRYDEAVQTAQRMVDLRPDQGSYSRVSYLRELHGDVEGALEAMDRAAKAGPPDSEGTLWALHQLAQLQLRQHRLDEAEATYRRALAAAPGYGRAAAGLAEVAAARGQGDEAVRGLEAVAGRGADPDALALLGDLRELAGRRAEAAEAYAKARAILRLDQEVGSDVELIVGVFDVEHGAMAAAQDGLNRYRKAYERAPNVVAADQLAWILFHAGELDEAWGYSELARRLGTRSASFHYHAGAIAAGRGDAPAARRHLQAALDISPSFSVRHAPRARELLARAQAGGRQAAAPRRYLDRPLAR